MPYLSVAMGAANAIKDYTNLKKISDISGYMNAYEDFGNQTYSGNFNDIISQKKSSSVVKAPTWKEIRGISGSGKVNAIISGAANGAMAGSSFGPWGAVAGAIIGGGASAFGVSEGDKEAKREANRLQVARLQAIEDNQNAYVLGMQNAAADANRMQMMNISSLGGYLDNPVDYYVQGRKKNRNQIPKFSNYPNTIFDFGGDLQTHGGDFSTGLKHIDAGKSHEVNPYDGVQMGVDPEGVPNLVEEGETVYNDYVFSNRILADEATKKMFHLPKKKNLTFADISKKLEKEISERPNDIISQEGFKAQMQKLEGQQERQKQEMEAERARAAFEALTPEEQAAVMQQVAQQDQNAQEQAIAEEAAAQEQAMEGMSPEEAQALQQQALQADGSQVAVEEPPMMAEGGNLYAKGSKLRKRVYNALGFYTDKDFLDWARKHKLRGDDKWEATDDMLKALAEDDDAWKALIKDSSFLDAIKDKPALVHALANDYDFGAYTPDNLGKVSFKDISKGNWTAQDYAGWKNSQDPAWLEAMEKGLVKEGMKQEDIAKALKQTNAYKRGTEWLQDNEDNRLRYLKTIIEDAQSPEVAKNYARKFIDNSGWKQNAPRDYVSIFGTDGNGVRETHPGTYWHTPIEAVREAQAKNWIINDDGSVDEIIGDIPKDWVTAGNYSWQTPENDITYNYYKRPTKAAASEADPDRESDLGRESDLDDLEPVKNPDWMRYAGLFGPAIGLGMQAAGIGKPDYSDLNLAVKSAGTPVLATAKYIGNYLKPHKFDKMFYANQLAAQTAATRKAVSSLSGGNRGTKIMGLLAADANAQNALGNLYRQAEEYQLGADEKVEGFNRGTNQFNAEAFNKLSQFNADEVNRFNQNKAGLRLQAAQERLNRDAGWYNSLYGNVNSLFKGISDLGRENRETNWRNALVTSGAFGIMDPDKLVDARIARRKNKKGLTR